ncbi:Wzz/FepE/Etk N-terminal domain-containing protein, partial [Klebsiella pneumoniae]|nr:Wzz/FepE/Etk N-terminal domain-containing protein [Klebsiella pneumoniae]HCJ4828251.1 tyrosine-protein kinase [Klebsiella pneumoniae]
MSSVTSNKQPSSEHDEIDLGRIVGEFIDHRKLIITITAIFTAISIIYMLFSTPVYQADAMIQVEQKQGNALLDNLSQMLPDSQPQSAPEIALLQSRMILGQTVDDLGLQAKVEQNYFPIFGKGWARLTGEKDQRIEVSRLYLPNDSNDVPQIKIEIIDDKNYRIIGSNFDITAKVGALIEKNDISIMISDIKAKPGTSFTVSYLTKLRAISELQQA